MERVSLQINMAMLKQQIGDKESKIDKITLDCDNKDRDMSEFMGELASTAWLRLRSEDELA